MKKFLWFACGLGLIALAIWAFSKYVMPSMGITYSGSETGKSSGGASIAVPSSIGSTSLNLGGGSAASQAAKTGGTGNDLLSNLVNGGAIGQGLNWLGSLFGGSGGGSSVATSPTDTMYSGLGLQDTFTPLNVPDLGTSLDDTGFSLGSFGTSNDGMMPLDVPAFGSSLD
jgi:hypothetical protein